MIHLSMPVSEIFGAGTCGKYLLREFSKNRVSYSPVGENLGLDEQINELVSRNLRLLTEDLDYPLLQFPGPDLEQQTQYRGKPSAAYLFSEWEPITPKQIENLKAFDVLIAGSDWNARVISDCGFECHSVPQGVDREIFYPVSRHPGAFTIYSGGKYEHRKAQDLVIKAVKVLQQRHKDILLVASWFNIWQNDDHYKEARESGVKLVGLPLCSHRGLAWHMNQTDVGLFPNRCEGGTNLMLMDYLACGKPVVANISTGQEDVLDPAYAFCIFGKDDDLVEEMIESVEVLYRDKNRRLKMGREADLAMDKWSWKRTANGLLEAINHSKNTLNPCAAKDARGEDVSAAEMEAQSDSKICKTQQS